MADADEKKQIREALRKRKLAEALRENLKRRKARAQTNPAADNPKTVQQG